MVPKPGKCRELILTGVVVRRIKVRLLGYYGDCLRQWKGNFDNKAWLFEFPIEDAFQLPLNHQLRKF